MNPDSNRPLSLPSAKLVAALLRDGVDVRLRLRGWSMKPLLRSGVVVQFSSTPSPRRGDIALIRQHNDSLVAHRVIAVDSQGIRTKGDACATEDATVPHDCIVGCAVRIEGKIFSLPLRNRWMRAVGLGLNRLYPRLVTCFRALVPREPLVVTGEGEA